MNKKDTSSFPTSPGVYIFKNSKKEIIYIGKAINLKNRISQYFQKNNTLGPKTRQLISQISNISYKTVGSEIEALVLEANLIKKHKPKYNSQLKDDKNYIYIVITKELIPRIFATHKNKLTKTKTTSHLYGPFPNSSSVRTLLKTIRKIFPFRDYHQTHPKNCLYCHLNLCPGPSPNAKQYRRTIGYIKKILNGQIKNLVKSLETQMRQASKTQNYEKAISLRDQIESLKYITDGWKNLNNLFQSINLASDKTNSALNELKTILLPYFPKLKSVNRIEAYDISNLGNKYFVGSMVVFQEGFIDKSQYRKFKIRHYRHPKPLSRHSESPAGRRRIPLESKIPTGSFGRKLSQDDNRLQQNDALMISQLVSRRLNHPEWQFPNIILVDGGKPQVTVTHSVIANSFVGATLAVARNHGNLPASGKFRRKKTNHIVLIGLAKSDETIVIKTKNSFQQINLPKNSQALNLLRHLRDESHRFANKYRKELMSLLL
ncbi:GIY-YIG nuclease family protein [Patescibacteria group bacterium]|nr:GIY-YIG nuclease family protein [Patescibacteria group bacterium]MCG2701918.1 GIY-YIG nuclease family protein [Candidatus Parcubacteria bacterium]MBU4265187.1 GIY-YIG nuclease family protein [Patescibacteria group bacterium]MBU4390751.1 GIY-YIG nuclease family protein [Patescibacteria group bacterium]MBU4397570.1 GIY-YIG nuclease family protein [Patescibacteria group bacterium]